MVVWYTSVDDFCGPVYLTLVDALEFLKQFEDKCQAVAVERGSMTKKEFESLPEFEGF